MDRQVFYAVLRRTDVPLFGTRLSEQQVRGIEGILDAFEQVGDGRLTTLAYALATAYGETGARMVPVREGFAKTDAGARRAVAQLAAKRGPNSAVAKYAQPAGPYGHVYYGRGQVQLTWLDNYRDSSADAGLDLVANPDAMLDPVISARVLIRGLIDGRWSRQRKGVTHYEMLDGVPGLSEVEAIAARRTVNVQDKAHDYAQYYRHFRRALAAAGMADVQVATTSPAPFAPPAPAPDRSPVGLLAAAVSWLFKFLKKGGPA